MPIITRTSPGNRLLICQSEIGHGLEISRNNLRAGGRTALQISGKAQLVTTAILQLNGIRRFAQFDQIFVGIGNCNTRAFRLTGNGQQFLSVSEAVPLNVSVTVLFLPGASVFRSQPSN